MITQQTSQGQRASQDMKQTNRWHLPTTLTSQSRTDTNWRRQSLPNQSNMDSELNANESIDESITKPLILNKTQSLTRKPNQRHIKGLSNFCNIKSTQLKGIKVSRLHEHPDHASTKAVEEEFKTCLIP